MSLFNNTQVSFDNEHAHSSFFAKSNEKALSYKNDTEGWTVIDNNGELNFIAEKKPVEGHPMGLLRGQIDVKGVEPWEVLAIVRDDSCRRIWDKDLYQSSQLFDIFTHNSGVLYVLAKKVFPASQRDMVVGVNWGEFEPGHAYFIGESMEHPEAPLGEGLVRGKMGMAGWHAEKKDDNVVRLTYTALSDPSGWLPGSLVSLVASQIPSSVKGVLDFNEQFGPPPFVRKLAGNLKENKFEHSTSIFTFSYLHQPTSDFQVTQIAFNKKRYPSGVKITISPPEALEDCYYDSGSSSLFQFSAKPNTQLSITFEKSSKDGLILNNVPITQPIPKTEATSNDAKNTANTITDTSKNKVQVKANDSNKEIKEINQQMKDIKKTILECKTILEKTLNKKEPLVELRPFILALILVLFAWLARR
eukprot:Lithocolla_globosa_v1_NODE_4277_length_1473_cov_13.336389.p1 type:complete len:417 gc:universal NODE_4277_length_1473_cov_13.336389:42-1292(+)